MNPKPLPLPYAAPEAFAEAIVFRNAAVRLVVAAVAGAPEPPVVELCDAACVLCDRAERLLNVVLVARRRAMFRVVADAR